MTSNQKEIRSNSRYFAANLRGPIARPRRATLFLCPAACVLACLFLTASTLSAQVSAVLSGTVTDPSHAVVAGANVTVRNMDTGGVRTAITDAAGRYQVVALPVGAYEVRVMKTGLRSPCAAVSSW